VHTGGAADLSASSVRTTLPLTMSDRVSRDLVLVECADPALDLSGDIGSVGRFRVGVTAQAVLKPEAAPAAAQSTVVSTPAPPGSSSPSSQESSSLSLNSLDGGAAADGDATPAAGSAAATTATATTETARAADRVVLDIKGIVYTGDIVPTSTVMVIKMSADAAKIDAVFTDYVRLARDGMRVDTGAQFSGAVDGFFDFDDDNRVVDPDDILDDTIHSAKTTKLASRRKSTGTKRRRAPAASASAKKARATKKK
jgi:hypothetical protein